MRMTLRVALGALITALAAAAAAASNDDVARGREVFDRCVACHSVKPGENLFGPTLNGIVGRPAGRLKGYAFSDALAAAKFVWTPAQLTHWLSGEPKNMVPGTRMEFPGITDEGELRELIAYLRTLKR